LDLPADPFDHAGEFVAADVRDGDVRVAAVPGVPIRSADPAGLDADQGAIRGALRLGEIAHLRRRGETLEDCGFHGLGLSTAGWSAKRPGA
jgi:hypothetical protein